MMKKNYAEDARKKILEAARTGDTSLLMSDRSNSFRLDVRDALAARRMERFPNSAGLLAQSQMPGIDRAEGDSRSLATGSNQLVSTPPGYIPEPEAGNIGEANQASNPALNNYVPGATASHSDSWRPSVHSVNDLFNTQVTRQGRLYGPLENVMPLDEQLKAVASMGFSALTGGVLGVINKVLKENGVDAAQIAADKLGVGEEWGKAKEAFGLGGGSPEDNPWGANWEVKAADFGLDSKYDDLISGLSDYLESGVVNERDTLDQALKKINELPDTDDSKKGVGGRLAEWLKELLGEDEEAEEDIPDEKDDS